MAVCDHKLRITQLVNRWPGSANDNTVFCDSRLCARFAAGQMKGYLLGDKGYGIKPYLMTPFADPGTPAERRFNASHAQVRNCIERAFGVLKQRWPVIKGTVNLDLPATINVITACFVLHNMLLGLGDRVDEDRDSGMEAGE